MWRCFGALIILTLVDAVAHAGSKQDITDCRGGSEAKISSEVERIEVCTRALKASKLTKEERARMHHSRATAYMRESRHAEAVADLDRAIVINPEDDLRSMYLADRAFNLHMSEDYDKAIKARTRPRAASASKSNSVPLSPSDISNSPPRPNSAPAPSV